MAFKHWGRVLDSSASFILTATSTLSPPLVFHKLCVHSSYFTCFHSNLRGIFLHLILGQKPKKYIFSNYLFCFLIEIRFPTVQLKLELTMQSKMFWSFCSLCLHLLGTRTTALLHHASFESCWGWNGFQDGKALWMLSKYWTNWAPSPVLIRIFLKLVFVTIWTCSWDGKYKTNDWNFLQPVYCIPLRWRKV